MYLALPAGACPVGLSCFLSAAAVAAADGGNGSTVALHRSSVAGVCVSRSSATANPSDEWVAHHVFSEAHGVAAQPPPHTCSVSRCGPGARPLLCAAGLTCVAQTASSSSSSSSSSSFSSSSSSSSGSGYGSCVLLADDEGTAAGTTVLRDYTDEAGEATHFILTD